MGEKIDGVDFVGVCFDVDDVVFYVYFKDVGFFGRIFDNGFFIVFDRF